MTQLIINVLYLTQSIYYKMTRLIISHWISLILKVIRNVRLSMVAYDATREFFTGIEEKITIEAILEIPSWRALGTGLWQCRDRQGYKSHGELSRDLAKCIPAQGRCLTMVSSTMMADNVEKYHNLGCFAESIILLRRI